MMLMTGAAALAAAVPVPQAAAEPEVPGQPANPGAPPAEAAPVNVIFADDFDGPAGAPPDYSRWTVVGWNEPVNPPILGLFRNDRRNVFLDGNGNLVLRATKEGNTYFSGRVEGTMKIGIGHTWEARVKLNCLVPGCWPAYWLVNREPTPDGRDPCRTAKSTSSSGTATVSGLLDPQCTRDRTGGHGGRAGGRWTGSGTPTRTQWDDTGFRFWRDDFAGPPYFTVPAEPIQGVWPFNAPDYLLYTVFNLAVGGPGGGDPAFGPLRDPGDAHRLRTRLVTR